MIHIMRNMERRTEKGELSMDEKLYKTMKGAGALNIVVGVITLIIGITSGVLLIVGGARLLAGKSKILF